MAATISGTSISTPELSAKQFAEISGLVYSLCGIRLEAGKEGLVKSRLVKRLNALELGNFDEYIDFIQRDSSGTELVSMIDSISTNKTSFFRENQHFDFVAAHVLPHVTGSSRPLRIWSAGCSSGEEPFSIAILLADKLPAAVRRDIRILATDISTRMLTEARAAVYDEDVVRDVPPLLLQKHFRCVELHPPRQFQVNDDLRAMVRFARLNLLDDWPMSGPFDLIFCRNVMIYFDRPTRERLVNRFWNLLTPGGHLLVGHAESLTGLTTRFSYVQPAVYGKQA